MRALSLHVAVVKLPVSNMRGCFLSEQPKSTIHMESTQVLQCSGSAVVLFHSPKCKNELSHNLIATSLPGISKTFLKAPVHPSAVVFFPHGAIKNHHPPLDKKLAEIK